MGAKPSGNRLLIAAPSLSAPDIARPRSGATLCLSATALGLLVAACAGPYQQQRAALEPQHTHATCARISGEETRHSCRAPRLAALSPGVRSARMNVPAPGRLREEADTARHPQSGSNRRSVKVAPAAVETNKAAPAEVAPAAVDLNKAPALAPDKALPELPPRPVEPNKESAPVPLND
jgi:hypothetical protein